MWCDRVKVQVTLTSPPAKKKLCMCFGGGGSLHIKICHLLHILLRLNISNRLKSKRSRSPNAGCVCLLCIFVKLVKFILRSYFWCKEALDYFTMSGLKETLSELKTLLKVSSLYLLCFQRNRDNKHILQ